MFHVNPDYLKKAMQKIRENIPIGLNGHNKESNYEAMPDDNNEDFFIVDREYENASKQIGTLGSGNHFLEFQRDNEGFVWVMIHSGSRNLGYKEDKII